MRPGQQKQRGRGRNNNNINSNNSGNGGNNNQRKGQNPLTRTYDSSGPDVKIRGTAQHIAEKYMTLARDAQSSGDRVMAENYLQHAEHYNRIIAAAQAMFQERFQRDERAEYNEREEDDNSGNDNEQGMQEEMRPELAPQPVIDAFTPQPVIEGTPVEVKIEEEQGSGRAERQASSPNPRRRNAPRPRRTPRVAAGAEEGGPAEAAISQESPAE